MRAVAQGTGYAMLQMDFASNVEKEWLVAGPEYDTYDIIIDDLKFYGRNSSTMEMNICTRLEAFNKYNKVTTQSKVGLILKGDLNKKDFHWMNFIYNLFSKLSDSTYP